VADAATTAPARRAGAQADDPLGHSPEDLTGQPRRAAVLGSPVAHSLSPALHRAAYAALGLPWTYGAVEVTEPELPGFLAGLGPEWVGLSLTMPLKAAVLPLLAEQSSSVVLTGCANTVLTTPDGLLGRNTDVLGIVEALRDQVGGRVATAGTATILGGGATGRSALVALDGLGVRDAVAVVRRPEAVGNLRELAEACGVMLHVEPWARVGAHLGADLVISTVPAGAADPLVADLPAAVRGTLLDVVYAPWPSPLVRGWAARGGEVVPGQVMLLHQAALQVALMTGRDAPVEAMRAALPDLTLEPGDAL
jgi:shikimate dehydrogenase